MAEIDINELKIHKMTKPQLLAFLEQHIGEITTSTATAADQATEASNSAENASEKSEAAELSATTTAEKAAEATDAAENASTKSEEAEQSAITADAKATEATNAAGNASKQSEAAKLSATTAAGKTTEATNSAKSALKKSGEAEKSATTAADKATEVLNTLETAEKNNTIISSFVEEIDKEEDGHKAIIVNTKEEIEKVKEDIGKIKEEIKSLLPDAGATGLAHAFRASKLRYANDPMEKIDTSEKLLWTWSWACVWACVRAGGSWLGSPRMKNSIVALLLYFLFIASLCGVIALLIFSPEEISEGKWKINFSTLDLSFLGILSRISITIPLIWFALHVNKAINRRANLYEEYNYRQRLMELYVGFKDQTGDTEQGQKNLEMLTKVVFVNIMIPPGKKGGHESDSPLEYFRREFLSKKDEVSNQDTKEENQKKATKAKE